MARLPSPRFITLVYLAIAGTILFGLEGVLAWFGNDLISVSQLLSLGWLPILITAGLIYWSLWRWERAAGRDLDNARQELALLRQEAQAQADQRHADLALLSSRQDIQYGILAEISRDDDLEEVRQRILRLVCQGLEADVAILWSAEQDEAHLTCLEAIALDEADSAFAEDSRTYYLGIGEGLPGRVWASGGSRWIADLAEESNFLRGDAARDAGLSSAFAFTYGYHGKILGVLEFYSHQAREADDNLLTELDLLGNQLGLFFTLRHLEAAHAQDLEWANEAMELAHMGHWTWVNASQQVIWSDKLYEICGLERDEDSEYVEREAYSNIVHPDDLSLVKQASGEYLNGKIANLEHRILRPDGEERHVLFRGEPTLENDKVVRVTGFVQDITLQKRAEIALRESEQRFSITFQANALPNIITALDSGEIIDANEALTRTFGYEIDALRGRTTTEVGFWVDSDAQQAFLARVKADGQVRRYPARMYNQEREIRDVLLSTELINLQGKRCALSLCDDVTERKRLEQDLKLSAKAMEQTIESVLILDANRRIVTVNRAFSQATGYSAEEAKGQDPRELLLLPSGRHTQEELETFFETLYAEGRWDGELWSQRKDGDVFPERWSLSVVRDNQDEITHYVAVANDISEYKEYQQRLEYQAQHDALTGLPNRQLLLDRCEHALRLAERNDQQVAMLYLDLDRFKQVNDTLGHQAGDALLREVSQRMLNCVRGSDTVSRLGGDEFVILLEGITQRQSVIEIAEQLVEAISRPYRIEEEDLSISTSIGIALYPEHAGNSRLLMKRADEALYEAKSAGRNNFQFYELEMQTG